MLRFIHVVFATFFIITLSNGNVIEQNNNMIDLYVRRPRQIPDECRPPGPPYRRSRESREFGEPMPHNCCPFPDLGLTNPQAWSDCHTTMIKAARAKSQSDGENNPPEPFFSPDQKQCLINCVFNATGLLTSDGSVNEELLNAKTKAEEALNIAWSNVMESSFKKCIAAAKEADSQSQKVCKPGAYEYIRCMSRELFLNCPQEQWNNATECVELKDRLEKCPNLMPPRPSRKNRAQYNIQKSCFN